MTGGEQIERRGARIFWRCRICGYVAEGDEPPRICPICGATREYFDRFDPPSLPRRHGGTEDGETRETADKRR